jgi:hypothetical protein
MDKPEVYWQLHLASTRPKNKCGQLHKATSTKPCTAAGKYKQLKTNRCPSTREGAFKFFWMVGKVCSSSPVQLRERMTMIFKMP